MAEEAGKNFEDAMSKEAELRSANQQLKAANQQLRATEQELRKSRQQYKTIFEGSINAIAVYDAVDDGSDFVLRNFNPSAERTEKTKRKDVLGRSILEIFPTVAKFGLFDVFQTVFRTGKPQHHLEIIHENGRIFGWRENYVFKLPTGQVVAIYEDITERKKAEEARVEEHNLLRTLIDNLPDSIYVKDVKSRFVIGNIGVAHIMGLETPDEMIGKTDMDFHPKELASKYCADEQQIIRSGRPLISREERVIDQQKGQPIWNLVTKVPWRDSGGKIVGIVGIGRDITRRKQAEEWLKAANQQLAAEEQQLRSANQQLKATEQQLKAANQQLAAEEQQLKAANQQLKADEQQLKAANQQLKATAQQLKAANQQLSAEEQQLRAANQQLKATEQELLDYQAQLKSLASQLSLAEERERRRIAAELHDRISQSLVISKVKLDALCELTSSKELVVNLKEIRNSLDQSIQDTRSLTFDLSSPILYELGFEAAVAEWLTEQIGDKYDIATEFEDDELPKPLDESVRVLLFRDVRELLINIVKHARAHNVKISIRKVDDSISVSVEDDGLGFDPAKIAPTPTQTGGFGLFSIRERLEQLGGELEIDSKPGQGSKLTMTAPLKSETDSNEVNG